MTGRYSNAVAIEIQNVAHVNVNSRDLARDLDARYETLRRQGIPCLELNQDPVAGAA